LLWALGRDLPGAIEVKPADGDDWPAEVNEDFDLEADQQMHDEMALRFSLAGVQIIFSAVNETPGGPTIPAMGIGGSWIVKLPSREFEGVPENEYSMMTLARLIGMNVPAIDLVEPSDIENLPKGVEGLNGKAFVISSLCRFHAGDCSLIVFLALVLNPTMASLSAVVIASPLDQSAGFRPQIFAPNRHFMIDQNGGFLGSNDIVGH
jgi:serine/threonine-protein kinase HipA